MQLFKITLVLLTITSCTVFSQDDTVIYAKPQKGGMDCPGSPCKTLDDYIVSGLNNTSKESNITVKLLEGHHTRTYKRLNYEHHVIVPHTLQIVGYGLPERVVLENMKAILSTPKVIVMENFTVQGSTVSVLTDSMIISRHVRIARCIFNNSTITLSNADLTIRDSTFSHSPSTAITLSSSIVTVVGNVRFSHNQGIKGGALALIGSTMIIERNAYLVFTENRATKTGGAIFNVNPMLSVSNCFYQFKDYNYGKTAYTLKFVNNSADNGGNHIYGASLKSNCYVLPGNINAGEQSYNIQEKYFSLEPGYVSSLSPVSGDPSRVCLCDKAGKSQCEQTATAIDVYPGDPFTVAVVVVGGDFGITYGTVNAKFIDIDPSSQTEASLESSNQHNQLVNTITRCTVLNYTVYSNRSSELLSLATEEQHETILKEIDININVEIYKKNKSDEIMFISDDLRYSKTYLNITLLDCPVGFVLSEKHRCECHKALQEQHTKCVFRNETGYILRSSSLWIGTEDSVYSNEVALLLSRSCLNDLCITDGTEVDLEGDSDTQCAFKHAGRLCGGCRDGYSLAIGSSHCIHCSNNNNLVLLLFFAAAGFLLVFAISALNLTVTQGFINGLIFYANIVWTYQNVFLPTVNYKVLVFLKTFIAWLNLDFGIETCFIKGLDRYSKAWLQFVFPLYTAGMFFIGLRYSSKLSRFFGNRSVPTLATLLFLTYNKLLRTIIAGLSLANLTTFYNSGEGIRTKVWALDGNLAYGHHPHIYLLLAVVICFLFLWVPYTLLLLLMQWLRKIDHYGPLKIIARYKPVYDAYYGPLRDKHHYWFGVLLVAQGLLLVISSLTLSQVPFVNLLVLLGVVLVLLCYLNHIKTYKHRSVTVLETSFFINIAILTAGNLYFRGNFEKTVFMMMSGTVAFLEFVGVVLWNVLLRKINCRTKDAEPKVHYQRYKNRRGTELCTLDIIRKKTRGNIQYQDLVLSGD